MKTSSETIASKTGLLTRLAYLCGFSLFLSMFGSEIRAETAFERAVGYSGEIQELNRDFHTTFALTKKISESAAELAQQFKAAKVENDAISAYGTLQQLIVEMQELSLNFENPDRIWRKNGVVLGRHRRPKGITARAEQAHSISRVQLLQLGVAKHTTLKRARDITLELQTLANEYQDLFKRANRFFSSYEQLADVYGMRTRLEWKAALRQLAKPDQANLGARYLRAVTLRRLGRYEDAESEFKELAEMQTPMQPLFQAARAEALVLAGKTREGKRLVGSIQGAAFHYPGVQGYRGLIAALDADWPAAVSAWKVDLKNNGQEVGLRRNIAIGLSILSKKNPRDAERALEHIELADDLSAEDEWSVQLASAIVYQALDDRPKALAAAEHAAQKTSLECVQFCEHSSDQIKQGLVPDWNFSDH